MMRTLWLPWALAFTVTYGVLADRRFLLGAAVLALIGAVHDLAALRGRR